LEGQAGGFGGGLVGGEKKHKSAESFVNKLEHKICQAENSSLNHAFVLGKKSKTFFLRFSC